MSPYAGQSDVPEELMQCKGMMMQCKGMMMAALNAAPSDQMDLLWLVRQPHLLNGFHNALKTLPESYQRLWGLALFACLCENELEGTLQLSYLSYLQCQGSAYCSKAQGDGLFDLLYNTLEHDIVLKVRAAAVPSYTAALVRCCSGICMHLHMLVIKACHPCALHTTALDALCVIVL